MSAFGRGIARAVRGSLGRFLAIAGIVALGCGFYAGLRMCGPDMRSAADAYYDDTALWDVRVVSTLGLGEKDLARLASVEGVAAVEGAVSVDAMANVGSEQVAVRVMTLPGAYETGGEPELDRLVLREGRLPVAADECVVSADNPALAIAPGQSIELVREAGDGGLLATTSLTVVGTVSSSAFPYTVSFGTTTLGSGSIDQYLYVPRAAFSEDAPLTEAHLTVSGAAAEESGSAGYEHVVGEVSARLEDDAEALALARLEDVRADAQAAVDEARAEYEDERASAEEELAAAREELDAAAEQIATGEAELADGEAALGAARDELEDGRAAAAAELEGAQAQIDGAQAELDAREAELDAAAEGAEAARVAVDSGVPALLAALSTQGIEAADLDGASAAIDAALAETSALREQISDGIEHLEALEAAGALTPEQAAQLSATREQLATTDAAAQALTSAQGQASQLMEARDAVAAYDDGRAQVSAAREELDAARAQLADSRTAADARLAAAEDEIAASEAQLSDARSRLADARAQYDDGLAAWEASRAEADERLADAQAQIDEAQAELDALGPGELYVLDRTLNEGTATYQADSERMDTIATIFPFMFFLVAALVSLTTMTRMVEDERGLIGLYKALGYGTARIASKYLAYAGIAAGLGAALGIAVLTQVLPLVIMSAYGIIYAVPQLGLPLPIDPATALLSAGLGVGVTLFATWSAVVSALRSTPATLMQPRAPKAGRRIILERVRPLWRRLSFLRKVTARNLFRYKKRLLMTVIGISGCTALLLVGFGLHDAIWDIIDNQFGQIVHYDTTVTLEDGVDAEDVDSVAAQLDATGISRGLARVHQENLQLRSASSEGGVAVRAIVPQDASELAEAVTLRDRVTHEAVPLGQDGLLLAEKTASKLGVGVGDEVLILGQDAAGNALGTGTGLRVSGIVENYVWDVAYVGRGAWAQLAEGDVTGEAMPSFSVIYATSDGDPAEREALAAALEGTGLVSTVVFTDETVDSYRDMLSAIDLIVVVLIVSAAALAFIVLYNLTNINIGERVREIATLKVLGFKRGEVYAYVYREILILALLGDALGLVLGTWLEGVVIVTAEVDAVMFGRVIHPLSYVYAFALTLAFSGLVMLVMRRRLDRVDMVESLKSVD